MLRLFVAIDLPDHLRARLARVKTTLEGARWVPEAQLHLTLRFIGDAEPEPIEAALAKIEAPSFELALRGVGRFPPRRDPHVLWAGLAPSPPLLELAKKIEAAVVSAGVEPEAREFSPHITLARLKHTPKGAVEKLLEEHRELSSEPFTIDHFRLYASTLSNQGAIHKVIAKFPLRAAGS